MTTSVKNSPGRAFVLSVFLIGILAVLIREGRPIPVNPDPSVGVSGISSEPSGEHVKEPGTYSDTAGVPGPATLPTLTPVGDTHRQFGQLIQGAKVTHTFHSKNLGIAPVVITQISRSCGCTKFTAAVGDQKIGMREYSVGDPILPGELLEITATLDTSGKRDTLTSTLSIEFLDSEHVLRLRMGSSVISPLVLTPPTLQFLNLDENVEGSSMVVVESPILEHFQLEIVGVSDEIGIEVLAVPRDPDEHGFAASWEVHVEPKANAPKPQNGNWAGFLVKLRALAAKESLFGGDINEELLTSNLYVSVRH